MLGPKSSRLHLLSSVTINRIRPPDESTCIEHAATGDTHRSTPTPHIEGMSKGRSLPSQSIEIGGLDNGMSRRSQRFEALIIGKHEKNVRLLLFSRGHVLSQQQETNSK